MLGGAGSGCLVDSEFGGQSSFDRCCVGSEWDADYDSVRASACGAPRTCDVAIGLYLCQDEFTGVAVKAQCCIDGHWHIVDGDYQYEPADGQNYLVKDQRSPACDGRVWHSWRALHLDGASYVELPVEIASGYPEMELWFRTSVPRGPLLTSPSTTHRLYLAGGKLCFTSASDGPTLCTSETSFADGAWHHAAHTRQGLFADGTLRVESYDPNPIGPMTTMRAGYGPVDDEASPEYFLGDLDEIRIWREPRGETAVFDYQKTRIVDEVTRHRLFGYFPLEQTGSVAIASNEAKEELEYTCTGDPEGGFSGFGGGPSEQPAGTLVGFTFTTSPWFEPGAF